jgi:hypothetical protein
VVKFPRLDSRVARLAGHPFCGQLKLSYGLGAAANTVSHTGWAPLSGWWEGRGGSAAQVIFGRGFSRKP